MWAARNKILHANSPLAQQIQESSVDKKIRHLYHVQDTFAASDRILFDMPLETPRLKTSARSKKHWIVLVARYHDTTKEAIKPSSRSTSQLCNNMTWDEKKP